MDWEHAHWASNVLSVCAQVSFSSYVRDPKETGLTRRDDFVGTHVLFARGVYVGDRTKGRAEDRECENPPQDEFSH